MARYDYQCEECAEVFEEEHPMTYDGPVECPICGTCLTHKVVLETPGMWIYWKDARSSSEATLPRYMRPAKRDRQHPGKKRRKYGNNDKSGKVPQRAGDDIYPDL